MKLAFGSDHAGFRLRKVLVEWARSQGNEVQEVGANSEEPYDYPDAADAMVPIILHGDADLGVLICGTGIGMSIRANRHEGIRAAVCCSPVHAELARLHNHANVLCLGQRTFGEPQATAILETFVTTGTDDAERHVRRVQKLDAAKDT